MRVGATVGVDLPRRALNDRPEDDLAPVMFEKVAKQFFKTRRI